MSDPTTGLASGASHDELFWRVPAGGGELVIQLHPWAFVCATGFPARLIDDLGHPVLSRLTERMLATHHRLASERHRFQQRAAALRASVLRLPPGPCADARRCLESVRTGVPLSGDEIRLLETLGLGGWARRWQSAVVAASSARTAARSAHAAAWLVTRRKVAEAYDDESVRHAISVAAPAFSQAIVKHPLARRPGDGTARRSRLLTATAHRHLRRLATAIETAPLPGPTRYAHLDPSAPEPLHAGPPGREQTTARPPGHERIPIGGYGLPGRERVTIGGAALARLGNALSCVMPLCYLAALLAREDAEDSTRSAPHDRTAPPPATGDAISRPAGPARIRELGGTLRQLVSGAHRQRQDGHRHPPGPDIVRLSTRDIATATAHLWPRAGDRYHPCLPAPHLTAIGPDLASATWLLSDLHDDRDTIYPTPPGEHGVPVAASPGMTIDLGTRTPRVVIGTLVYQRARWRFRLPGERGADAFDRWTAIHRLRAEHGLPRHVIVHHPAEPQPFHVDLCDPLAVEDLARRDPAEVLVTEMLPAPGDLWWRVADEEQYAELRLACLLQWAAGR